MLSAHMAWLSRRLLQWPIMPQSVELVLVGKDCLWVAFGIMGYLGLQLGLVLAVDSIIAEL